MLRPILILFISGAIAGTLGDWTHVLSGTLGYPDPLAPIPGTGQPFWVPFLFGGAALLMELNNQLADRLVGPASRKTWTQIVLGACAFLLLYGSSGFLPLATGSTRDFVLMLGALAIWLTWDRSWRGLILGLIAATFGVLVEMTLTHLGVFYYFPNVGNWNGVPSWLPWIYISASIAEGNLGRLLLRSE